MPPRWTHKITYKPTGELWYCAVVGGKFYYSDVGARRAKEVVEKF